jgi:hypothetical protein
VDGIHDPKKKDGKHGGVQSKSGKPASKDRFCVCSRPCCSNGKSEEENEAFDEKKLQESNEVSILTFMHVFSYLFPFLL